MRYPTFASIELATKWKGFKFKYDPPIPLRFFPGDFFCQGCTSMEAGFLRIAVVWSNPRQVLSSKDEE